MQFKTYLDNIPIEPVYKNIQFEWKCKILFSIKHQLYIAYVLPFICQSTDLHAQSECLRRKYDMKDVVMVKTKAYLQMLRPLRGQLRIFPVMKVLPSRASKCNVIKFWFVGWSGQMITDKSKNKLININERRKKIMCDILYCGVSAVIYNAELNKTFSKIRLCFEY